MTYVLRTALASFLLIASLGETAQAQVSEAASNPAAFASENAILDTAILFAIGAREARQALRGAFGWPNFQEGLVEGVYFRFDPDGYARFAPTPRLDVDVFEVICRPRTYACAARKEGIEAFLTERGQLQLKLEEALAGDQFFVSEGISEIQVPERILQPLDVQLEVLLSTGGELVIRRGGAEVSRISLKGFSAVAAYLRWIAARQDYAVLPRGWPIPNAEGGADGSGVTASATWNSPMPQPQVLAPGYGASLASGIAPATSAAPLTAAAVQAGSPAPIAAGPAEDALSSQELRTELETLKQIILQAQIAQSGVAQPRSNTPEYEIYASTHSVTNPETPADRGEGPFQAQTGAAYGDLLAALEGMQNQLNALQPPQPVQDAAVTAPLAGVQAAPVQVPQATEMATLHSEAQKLDFLVTTLGLDAQTALSVLRLAMKAKETAAPLTPTATSDAQSYGASVPATGAASQDKPILYQGELVDQILAELEAEIASSDPSAASLPQTDSVSVQDYVLLSRYFKSAALPELQKWQQDMRALSEK